MANFELRSRPLDLHLRHVFRIARGASAERHNLLVELEALGCVGLGEAAPILRSQEDRASAAAAVAEMAPRLGDLRCFASAARRAAVAGQSSAQAAVDMALHDLAGKRLGVPLHELLGLDTSRMPQTSFTIGMDTPEAVVRKVREAAEYPILKIKLGSPDDRELLTAVRDTTDRVLRVDANEGWDLQGAQERLEFLAKIGVEFVEQPLPAGCIEETRALRKRSPLPFVADESVHRAEDIPRLAGAFDGINIKLMKCGGLGEALRMIAVARAHGLQVMLGCMIETSLAITAAAQIAALVDTTDLDGHVLISDDPFRGVVIENGVLRLPDGPGLGVTPRE